MKDNRTSVKRNLLVSAIALTLTAALLIGTTFAWFTSTATTSVSDIKAGKLTIDIVGKDGKSLKDSTLSFKNVDGSNKILWEPGATYSLDEFALVNTGNLALKYKVTIDGVTGDEGLLNVIDFTVKQGDGTAVPLTDWEGVLLPKGATAMTADEKVEKTDPITISGTMKSNADNTYQNQTLTGIKIAVTATQYTYEKDSKDNQYDKDAPYPVIPVVATADELKTSLTLDAIPIDKDTGNHVPVEVTLGTTEAEQINYSEHDTGYTGKGVMLGSTKLNKYAAAPAKEGEYSFIFKDGTINSAAKGYESIDKFGDTSVYMLVPGNSDVTFENMTFNGVVSFGIQKYTSPWSHLNSITFKNCTFNGIIVGTCPASYVTIDGCTFNNYTNTTFANNSNPIWWRADYEGQDGNATYIKAFTFTNNKITSTRPVKIERIGRDGCNPVFTFKNNSFDITSQSDDTVTKNMAINIGQWDNNSKFTLIDEGNRISKNTAALYTAALGSGSNQYVAVSGNKVLDGNGNEKTITALVWKTKSNETFEMKSIN